MSIVVVLLPDFAWVLFANDKSYAFSRPYAVMSGLLPSVTCMLLLAATLGSRLWVAALLLAPFLPLVPVETAYIANYGEPTWYAIVATAFESNSREAVDFIGPVLWPLLFASALCLLLAIVTIWSTVTSRIAWRGKSRQLMLVVCLSLILAPIAIAKLQTFGSSAHAINSESMPEFSWTIEPSFPIGVLLRLIHYETERDAMQTEARRFEHSHFEAHAIRTISSKQIYVLVIGEASRADNWQLYGYERATNPELTNVANLVRLSNIITPWSASRMSVPIITSRKKGTDTRSYFNEGSILRAFSEAGFVTYWISNQMAAGVYDSPISIVAHQADHVLFVNFADYSNQGSYDEVLINPLKAAIDKGDDRLFIVLHTLGSHENYAYRYPDGFDQFTPSLKGMHSVNLHDLVLSERIRNSYDNSILYTDHVISEVIGVLRETNAIASMWYVSDHGEDLVTPTCSLTGHGSGTVYNFRIPSVFWYSDRYAAEFKPQLNQLRAHQDERVSTENIFESMIDMANIDFPGHDRSWSLFSGEWQPHPRIITPLYGQVRLDFDSAGESKNCHMMTPPH